MPPKKKAANGYKFAEPLPKGIILEDIGKRKWRLGTSVGKGGFGEIYSAQEENSKSESYPYVIKIEPHANGPLFVEINFYLRHAKPAYIEDFKREKGLKTFGLPVYYGSGSIEYKGEKYRFLVMDKFSTDLYKLYIDNNKVFPTDTVFKLGLQILDVLEYIHQRGYVHADIKAANILLGATKETQNKQVYLVDFGLATKYTMDKEFKPNPKKAHDGTIEFLSRDAHQGVQTRRGDLEILAYNLIQWLGCKLPWESNLSDPKVVQNSKEENMANVPKMIKSSFGSTTPPKAIIDYLKCVNSLKFNTEPDYKKIRNIFLSGVKEGGGSIGTPLQFSESRTPLKRNRTPLPNSRSKRTKSNKEEENGEVTGDEDETPKPKKRERGKKYVSSNKAERNSEISGDEDKTPKPKKRERKRHLKRNKNEENGKISGDEDETLKPKKREIVKKKLTAANEENDVGMTTADSSDGEPTSNFITTRKPKNMSTNTNIILKKTRSLENLSVEADFIDYPDSMKEIGLKKINSDMPLKRNRTRPTNKKSKKVKPNKDNENSEVSCDEDQIPTSKNRGRAEKDVIVASDINAVEMASTDTSEDETSDNIVTRRREPKNKTTGKKKGIIRKMSKSVDDLSNERNFEGYTDAMKEIVLRKLKNGGRKKRTNLVQKSESPTNQNGDDMTGFTEEMKAIALKKKSKEKTGKKRGPAVPIATTSKANTKRGLVQSDSKRLQKKTPVTHGEVLGYSDGSVSD